jgi:hypothetical protein
MADELWKPDKRWELTDWVPLQDAAERIDKCAGNWYLSLRELHRRLFAGDLRSGAVIQPYRGPELRVTLKKTFWGELEIKGFAPKRTLWVNGTLEGEKFLHGPSLSWTQEFHLFVRRADLDKLYRAEVVPAPEAAGAKMGSKEKSENLQERRSTGVIKYEWGQIYGEIARRCVDPQGRLKVPKSANGLAAELEGWCETTLGKIPSNTELREAVKHIFDALRPLQK